MDCSVSLPMIKKEEEKKRIQTAFTITMSNFDGVKEIAKDEKRSRSQVMDILIGEALKKRKLKNNNTK